jgi:DNA-binding MarR family transcriptional regulator
MNAKAGLPSIQEVAVLRRAVIRLARRLRIERPSQGLSSTKLSLLGHLHRTGPLTPGGLADLERSRPQALTRVLAELESDRLVSRRPDPVDRRQAIIEITSPGLERLAQDMHRRDAWLASAMAAALTPTERELLRLSAGLLDRLGDVTSARNPRPQPHPARRLRRVRARSRTARRTGATRRARTRRG